MASNLLQSFVRPTKLFGRGSLAPSFSRDDVERDRNANIAKQLSTINQNVIAIASNIRAVSTVLSTQETQKLLRARQEQNRRNRIAEKESFGGAERALEASLVRAIKAPITAITKTVSGPLESLKKALFLLFGGWLTDKVLDLFDEKRGSFTDRLTSIGFEITKGVAAAIGAFSILDGGFFRIIGIIGKLALRIGKFLVLSPFKILRSLFKIGRKAPGTVKPRKTSFRGGRLGKFFSGVAAIGAGVIEYQGAREAGYTKELAGLKSALVTGASITAGTLAALGLKGLGLASGGAGLLLLPAGVVTASTAAGAGTEALFENFFGGEKSTYQGETPLYTPEGKETDYVMGIYEDGVFEVKEKGILGFGKRKILDSDKILSGEQTIQPNGKNAELLEYAVRQQHVLSIGAPDQEKRHQYGRQVAEKAFGMIPDIKYTIKDGKLVQGSVSPEKAAQIQTLIDAGLPEDVATRIINVASPDNNLPANASNIGMPSIIPVIPTKNPLNQYNDLARQIYQTRL